MSLSLKQLQDLTTKLDNLDMVGGEVTEISFSFLLVNVVSFKLDGETKYYYFHDNQWNYITQKKFDSLFV